MGNEVLFQTLYSLQSIPSEFNLAKGQIQSYEKKPILPINHIISQLLDLTYELLDLSKLEKGNLKLHLQRKAIEKFLAQVEKSCYSLADEDEITISKNIDFDLSESRQDVEKLGQLINKIFFSAFNFSQLQGKRMINITPAISHTEETSFNEKFLKKVKSIINQNISNFNFSVTQLANEIALSRSQLLRRLKAITGFSPNELITDIRLQKAAERILAKTDTLTQISYSVGFNEQSYFAKRFRKKFGVTPGNYATHVNTVLNTQLKTSKKEYSYSNNLN